MALEERYESKDLIPESLAEHYVEQDGVYVLENVIGALGAKQRVKTEFDSFKQTSESEINSLRDKLNDYEQQASEAQKKAESDKRTKLEQDGKHDELYKLDIEKRDSKITQLEEELAKINSTLESERGSRLESELSNTSDAISGEIAVMQGDNRTFETISALLKTLGRVKNINGKQEFYDIDGKVVDMKPKEYAEYLKEYDPVIRPLTRGTMSEGGFGEGSRSRNGSGNTMSREQFDKLPPSEKMKFSQAGGKIR